MQHLHRTCFFDDAQLASLTISFPGIASSFFEMKHNDRRFLNKPSIASSHSSSSRMTTLAFSAAVLSRDDFTYLMLRMIMITQPSERRKACLFSRDHSGVVHFTNRFKQSNCRTTTFMMITAHDRTRVLRSMCFAQ